MINFIDHFVSVSTHPGTVGAEVARIAEEVNKHHHTKTCRPQPKCRFRFPKLPIWATILVMPYEARFPDPKPEEKAHFMKNVRIYIYIYIKRDGKPDYRNMQSFQKKGTAINRGKATEFP